MTMFAVVVWVAFEIAIVFLAYKTYQYCRHEKLPRAIAFSLRTHRGRIIFIDIVAVMVIIAMAPTIILCTLLISPVAG